MRPYLLAAAAALAGCDNSPLVDTPVPPAPPFAQAYDVVSHDRVVVLVATTLTAAAQPHLPGAGTLALTVGGTATPLRHRLSAFSVGPAQDTTYTVLYSTEPFPLLGPAPPVSATLVSSSPSGQQQVRTAAGTVQGLGLFSRFGRGERMLARAGGAGLSGELRAPHVALFGETPAEVERADLLGGVPVRYTFRVDGTFTQYRYAKGLGTAPDSTRGTYEQSPAQLVLTAAGQETTFRRRSDGGRVVLEREVSTCADALCLNAPAMRYEVPTAKLRAYLASDVLVLAPRAATP